MDQLTLQIVVEDHVVPIVRDVVIEHRYALGLRQEGSNGAGGQRRNVLLLALVNDHLNVLKFTLEKGSNV